MAIASMGLTILRMATDLTGVKLYWTRTRKPWCLDRATANLAKRLMVAKIAGHKSQGLFLKETVRVILIGKV